MSNQLTRIEREAADLCYDILNHDWGVEILPTNELRAAAGKSGYISGATSEFDRAAPVVKALERVKNYIPASDYEVLIHVEQILETYKNNNV